MLQLCANAGTAMIDQVGDLPGCREVWCHPEGMANVLSFDDITNKEGHKMECQNWVEDAFQVANPEGKSRQFTPSKKDPCCWNSEETIEQHITGTTLTTVETVAGDKAKHLAWDK